jgi:hypothetical protein
MLLGYEVDVLSSGLFSGSHAYIYCLLREKVWMNGGKECGRGTIFQ